MRCWRLCLLPTGRGGLETLGGNNEKVFCPPGLLSCLLYPHPAKSSTVKAIIKWFVLLHAITQRIVKSGKSFKKNPNNTQADVFLQRTSFKCFCIHRKSKQTSYFCELFFFFKLIPEELLKVIYSLSL